MSVVKVTVGICIICGESVTAQQNQVVAMDNIFKQLLNQATVCDKCRLAILRLREEQGAIDLENKIVEDEIKKNREKVAS